MDFFHYTATGTYNERLNLIHRISTRQPMLALNNPDYERNLRAMLLAGEAPESFRNRCRIADNNPSEMKDYIIQGRNRSERRIFDRFLSTGLQIHLIGPDFELSGVEGIDISLGGISVVITQEYDLAIGLTVGMALSHGDEQVLISGAVANIRHKPGKQVIGVKFDPAQVIAQELTIKNLIMKCIQERKSDRHLRSTAAA